MSDGEVIDIALVICGADRADSDVVALELLGSHPQGWAEIVIIDDTVSVPIPIFGGHDPGTARDDDRSPTGPRLVDSWRRTDADHLVFVPADCIVSPDAHRSIFAMISHNPNVDFAYFDSTGYQRSDRNELDQPCHRPGYSPDRLRSQMYLGEMFMVSRAVAESLAAMGPDESPLVAAPPTHQLALAATALSTAIAHIPRVLYRFPIDPAAGERGPQPIAVGGDEPTLDDGAEPAPGGGGEPTLDGEAEPDPGRPIQRHQRLLVGAGFPATAHERPGVDDVIDLEPELTISPPVSIVMPTNGSQREIDGRPTVLCLQAIDSVIDRTTYPDYELVLVITPGAPVDMAAQVLSTIDSHPPNRQPTVRFCRDDRPFNFSNACNRGAVAADGDLLVFLNDDTMVETDDWLDRLVMYGSQPGIGAVGARLHYGNGRIQHAGIWTRGGHPSHRYQRFPADHPGYMNSLSVPQNCLAVTGACLAVAADKFRAAGGFSPRFPSSYNDVDLCLKLDDLGYRTVVDPKVVLTHFEASSRDPKIDDWELALLHERWRSVLTDDPYDNPHHLAPESEEYPAPDPTVTERKRRAGKIDFLPRVHPRPRLTVDSASTPPERDADAGRFGRSEEQGLVR
ncbi:MAG: glycosyltransferase family 2 protein [Acidimicrobiales bacterium]